MDSLTGERREAVKIIPLSPHGTPHEISRAFSFPSPFFINGNWMRLKFSKSFLVRTGKGTGSQAQLEKFTNPAPSFQFFKELLPFLSAKHDDDEVVTTQIFQQQW